MLGQQGHISEAVARLLADGLDIVVHEDVGNIHLEKLDGAGSGRAGASVHQDLLWFLGVQVDAISQHWLRLFQPVADVLEIWTRRETNDLEQSPGDSVPGVSDAGAIARLLAQSKTDIRIVSRATILRGWRSSARAGNPRS